LFTNSLAASDKLHARQAVRDAQDLETTRSCVSDFLQVDQSTFYTATHPSLMDVDYRASFATLDHFNKLVPHVRSRAHPRSRTLRMFSAHLSFCLVNSFVKGYSLSREFAEGESNDENEDTEAEAKTKRDAEKSQKRLLKNHAKHVVARLLDQMPVRQRGRG
jgi:hypothetical protein